MMNHSLKLQSDFNFDIVTIKTLISTNSGQPFFFQMTLYIHCTCLCQIFVSVNILVLFEERVQLLPHI